MTKLHKEQVLQFSRVPDWCQSFLGHRVNRSTCHRWRTRGARGVQLESFMAGGRRYTSIEALLRFFGATTCAADDEPLNSCSEQAVAIAAAEAYLESEGIS